jgi:hypothetical protein
MANDPNIPLMVQPAQINSPFQVAAEGLKIQGMQQEAAINNFKMLMAQRDLQAQQLLANAYSRHYSADGSMDVNGMASDLASGGRGDLIPGIFESNAKYRSALADADKAVATAQTAKADALGSIGNTMDTLIKSGSAHDAAAYAAIHIPDLVNKGILSPQDGQTYARLLADPDNDPGSVQTVSSLFKSGSQKQQELDAATATAASRTLTANTGAFRLTSEMPGILAKNTQEQKIAAGMSDQGVTPSQASTMAEQASQIQQNLARLPLIKAQTGLAGAEASKAGIEAKTAQQQYNMINQFMPQGGGPSAPSQFPVQAPNGKTYYFPNAAAANAFKLKAGIQ